MPTTETFDDIVESIFISICCSKLPQFCKFDNCINVISFLNQAIEQLLYINKLSGFADAKESKRYLEFKNLIRRNKNKITDLMTNIIEDQHKDYILSELNYSINRLYDITGIVELEDFVVLSKLNMS